MPDMFRGESCAQAPFHACSLRMRSSLRGSVQVAGEQPAEGSALAALTDRQRQVLDLLIEHKSSKEIARALDISPHTVDQRIRFARDKLGVRTRSEVAVAYRRLLETYGQTAYGNTDIATDDPMPQHARGPQGSLPGSSPHSRFRSRRRDEPEADFQVGPEQFEGRNGTLVRLGWILGIALLLVFFVVGTLALYSQIAEFWRR
jgi:DNA-binding CsgD family transcriptional regulator